MRLYLCFVVCQVVYVLLQIQTEMMGDIHHYAWRARHRNQTVYINKRDSERFGDWTADQCAVSSLEPYTESACHKSASRLAHVKSLPAVSLTVAPCMGTMSIVKAS